MSDITVIINEVGGPTIVIGAGQGVPGTSPYQIAVQNGYMGTELEYSMLVILAAAASADQTELCRLATLAADAATTAANAIVAAGLLMIPDRQTGAAFTIPAADYGGVVERENASANTTTLRADAPVGANVVVAQMGAGQTTLTAASGATVVNASGLLKTRALYSEVSCRVTTNAGGSAAVWLISGDLA